MGDGFELVPLDGDFGLISGDWAVLRGIDLYRKGGRGFGGSGGWRFDPAMVEAICKALSVGCDRTIAAGLVGLPTDVLDKWMNIGERVSTLLHEHGMTDITDEEEGFLWLWVNVSKAENLWLAKMPLTIDQGMSGNKGVSDQKMRIALDVLAKRNPAHWERKNGVVLESKRLSPPAEDEPGTLLGGRGSKEGTIAAEAARQERDKEYERRKNRGTINGEG